MAHTRSKYCKSYVNIACSIYLWLFQSRVTIHFHMQRAQSCRVRVMAVVMMPGGKASRWKTGIKESKRVKKLVGDLKSPLHLVLRSPYPQPARMPG